MQPYYTKTAVGAYRGPQELGRRVQAFFAQPMVAAVLLGLGGFAVYRVFVKPELTKR